MSTHALLLLYYFFKRLVSAHAQYSLNTQISFASTAHTLDLVLHAKHSNIQALTLAYILEHKRFHTCNFASGWFGNRVKFNLMCVAVIIN